MCIEPVRWVFALMAATVISTPFAVKNNQAAPLSESKQQVSTATPRENTSQSSASLELPIKFERRVGDLDAMVKRHEIRVLVIPSRVRSFSTMTLSPLLVLEARRPPPRMGRC
jgi:hypothetical protein